MKVHTTETRCNIQKAINTGLMVLLFFKMLLLPILRISFLIHFLQFLQSESLP